MRRTPQEKHEQAKIHFFQTAVSIKVDELLTGKPNEAVKIALFNLETNIIEINHEVPDQLKITMMQQALINAYYAVRQTENSSLTLFGSGGKTADSLERLVNEIVLVHGGKLRIPHEVNSDDKTISVFNTHIQDFKTNSICNELGAIHTELRNVIDHLLLRIGLIYFGKTEEKKDERIAQLLVDQYYLLRQNYSEQASQLADQLQSLLSRKFELSVPASVGAMESAPHLKYDRIEAENRKRPGVK